MDAPALKRYQPYLTILLLIFFMVIAFILRIIPAALTRDMTFFPVYDTDTWYNLRQIEVMVHQFPQYNWFDPMTAYPSGKFIDWGPLYPFLAALLCMITGASTQGAIIAVSGYVSTILAVLMVPVIYCTGKILRDSRTGLVAAGLVAVSSLLYFSFSSYGMVDHHIAEVFFSSLLFLAYLSALAYAREKPVDIRNKRTLPAFCLIAAAAGIVYFLGLITSTTVILALLVIAIFTFVQGIADFHHRTESDYLVILNLVMLGVATILIILFGFKRGGISFTQYSIGIVYLHAAVMAGSVMIGVLGRIFLNKRVWFFITIAVLGAVALAASLLIPVLRSITGQALDLLLGFSVYNIAIQETLPWSVTNAFDAVNVGIILAAGGFLVLGWYLAKRQDSGLVFFGIWSVLMLLITIEHQRFLYYFTVNIVLLAAFCITEPFRWQDSVVCWYFSTGLSESGGKESPGAPAGNMGVAKKKKKQRDPVARSRPGRTYLAGICLVAVCLLALMHVAISLQQDYQFAAGARDRVIPGDWLSSLTWLRENSPDPGIDYFGRYDLSGYSPPGESYGILSVWDAGHWITFFAHRPAITNPFQDNLEGEGGTAAFFLEENESAADSILESYRGRYVITDSTMAVDRFTNLVAWIGQPVDISPYIKWFLIPDTKDSRHLNKIHLYDTRYYRTMVTRLHIFDGSMTEPTTANYTRYTIRPLTAPETAEVTGTSRVITEQKVVTVPALDTTTPLMPEGTDLREGDFAGLYSSRPDRPLETLPALRHYRLVHESPEDSGVITFPESGSMNLAGIKRVKIFEYVTGAHIAGNGIIELPVVTNTGRNFTYRQESSGGEFIVPYATTEKPDGVRATGPYHIAGTDRFFTVAEDDVLTGKTVTAGR